MCHGLALPSAAADSGSVFSTSTVHWRVGDAWVVAMFQDGVYPRAASCHMHGPEDIVKDTHDVEVPAAAGLGINLVTSDCDSQRSKRNVIDVWKRKNPPQLRSNLLVSYHFR